MKQKNKNLFIFNSRNYHSKKIYLRGKIKIKEGKILKFV